MREALFEACIESVDEGREAAAWGATRVELCVDLANDGCTPSSSLAADCVAKVVIPVVAMVRPRPGDFVYSAAEIEAMCESMRELAHCGVAGFATGALRPDNEIDVGATTRLVDAAGGLPVTFHRAFDRAPDLLQALDTLATLGVRRVLSSGGAANAELGAKMLRRLVVRAEGRVEVVAAGGVRPHNVRRILATTGAPAVHARWTGWRAARRS